MARSDGQSQGIVGVAGGRVKVGGPALRYNALAPHHPWTPFSRAVEHPLRPKRGCLLHGLACQAQAPIQAAVDGGLDPST